MKSVTWRSPSNIALIKYWGKHAGQIPANPSLSFTLSACYTQTRVSLQERQNSDPFDFRIFLDGEEKESFRPKIDKFLNSLADELSFLRDYQLEIHSHNSFPHSSGIASSASGMSALALCLLDLKMGESNSRDAAFWQKASEWSRIGSGSAARSVYGPLAQWGRYEGLPESSDHFAIPFPSAVHPVYRDFRDYVLLVEVGAKSVSSTAGHALMNNHPFAARRFEQAHHNLKEISAHLQSGDLSAFGEIVESEALTLHAMMMTSRPYYMLMKPATLQIIDEIWAFRSSTALPLYFTLDAGANIHLLFPAKIEQAVKEFVNSSLVGLLKNEQYICDRLGNGPEKISE